MNNIISRIENILAADGWKRTAMLQVFLDELKEKRDAALKAKDEKPEISKEVATEIMILHAQEAVREFNRAVVDVKTV